MVRLTFGAFEFFPESGELHREGRRHQLRKQSAKALEVLLLRAGSLTRRDELCRQLWDEGTHVDHDQGINSCIREIRLALGDDAAHPTYVETLAGRGYRFLAAVERVGEPGTPASAVEPTPEAPAAAQSRAWPGPRTLRSWSRLILLAVLTVALGLALATSRPWDSVGWAGHVAARSRPVRALLGELENRTGDDLLDDSLAVALRVGLEQNQGLELVPAEEVRRALIRMQRPADAVLDRELCLELAQRLNADRILLGSTARAGSEYLVALEVVEPASAASLHAATQRVRDRDQLLDALDRVIGRILDGLAAESPSRRPNGPSLPLSQVTTASLEALKAYSVAERETLSGHPREARYALQDAVELDPSFAMAHARLGIAYWNIRDPERALFHLQRARQSRGRLTAFEALYLDAWLATVEPDPGQAIRLWTRMTRLFPDRPLGHYNLAMVQLTLRSDFAACAAGLSRALEADPEGLSVHVLSNRAICRQGMEDVDQALDDTRAVLNAADVPTAVAAQAWSRLVTLGSGAEAREYQEQGRFDGNAVEALPPLVRATLLVEWDRPQEAFDELRRLGDLAADHGQVPAELAALVGGLGLLSAQGVSVAGRGAFLEHVWRRSEELLGEDEAGYRSLQLRGCALLGASFARHGQVARARRLRDRFVTVRAQMTNPYVWQGYLDLLDAELALEAGRAGEAARVLEASTVELPGPPYHGREILARAYLALGNEAAATETFRWMASHRGWAHAESLGTTVTLDRPLNALAYGKAVKALSAADAG